jgi:hypothetical protein
MSYWKTTIIAGVYLTCLPICWASQTHPKGQDKIDLIAVPATDFILLPPSLQRIREHARECLTEHNSCFKIFSNPSHNYWLALLCLEQKPSHPGIYIYDSKGLRRYQFKQKEHLNFFCEDHSESSFQVSVSQGTIQTFEIDWDSIPGDNSGHVVAKPLTEPDLSITSCIEEFISEGPPVKSDCVKQF